MGWLKRLFGLEKPEQPPAAAEQTYSSPAPSESPTEDIPPEKMGLSGEYDQSGLAKRVALAFDEDSQLDDIDTLWVAQTATTVVLKGKVPSQEILDQMIAVASNVSGATGVDTAQVDVG